MESFSNMPPFADDVPTAPLLSISVSKLRSHDPAEASRLFAAAQDTGFFYLDYHNVEEETSLTKDVNNLFEFMKHGVFDVSDEEKKHWDMFNSQYLTGYKTMGANVVDKEGHQDWVEFCNVSKVELFAPEPMPLPASVNNQRPLIQSFVRTCHGLGTLLLDSLNNSLNLPPATLSSMHNLSAPSGDQVRFTKAAHPGQPSQKHPTNRHATNGSAANTGDIALNEHTDVSSISILFNRLGGLQILPPASDACPAPEWCYVKPRAGHAIVNLGDAMVRWTNKLFTSNIHRVVAPPGEQARLERNSLVYFMRPDYAARLKRLDGSDAIPALSEGQENDDLDAKEWTHRRFAEIRDGTGLLEKERLKVKGFGK